MTFGLVEIVNPLSERDWRKGSEVLNLAGLWFFGLFEDPVYQSLVWGAYIFQAKGHDPIAEVSIHSNECHFLFIWGVQSNLIVS